MWPQKYCWMSLKSVVIVAGAGLFDRSIRFCVNYYHSNEGRQNCAMTMTIKTMNDWNTIATVRLPHTHYDYLNQWICKLYVSCQPMNEQKAYLLYFCCVFFSHPTTKIHFMAKEACTTIYMQQNSIYMYWQRECREKYLFNVYFFVLYSHALSPMFDTFAVLFCFFRLLRFFLLLLLLVYLSLRRIECVGGKKTANDNVLKWNNKISKIETTTRTSTYIN